MNPVYRTILSLDWITIALFISLILLTVSKYFFSSSFTTFFILPFNNKYLKINKKKGKIFNGFHVLLTIFQLINLSLFGYLASNVLNDHQIDFYPTFFWVLLICLLCFLCVKIVLQLGNGYFFQNQHTMTDLIFEKLTYFNYGGLIAFLGNVLLAYAIPQSKIIVYATIILLCIINCIGFINVLRNHQKLIISNIMYFILYLCALEISPLVIIVGYLKS